MHIQVDMQRYMQKQAPKSAAGKEGDNKIGDNEDVLVLRERQVLGTNNERQAQVFPWPQEKKRREWL